MAVDPTIQAQFERDYIWKRSWPRCFLGLITIVEVLLGLVIFLTEVLNILMDFWHTNIFGGIWASFTILINWILLYMTVCCRTTVGASTCALFWNLITLIALGVLIAFDIIFILNPYTCLLTSTCSTQPQVISLNSIMQLIPAFHDYSSYDSKKFFLQIQVGCAGGAFLISLLYIIIYIVCRMKLNGHVRDIPKVASAPPLPSGFPTAPQPYST
ncbi:unnamed protein product [Adineta ricciae]|uniref:MARVEL domain-containing protein n=1 Tax=Adineta ricciae TaxID=249248 RepID=A0A814YXK5_ADIRI|nr:unnamed protein product [Adineta ricciae]CAF1235003.1 unnamed protein product [Adineta ricciae]